MIATSNTSGTTGTADATSRGSEMIIVILGDSGITATDAFNCFCVTAQAVAAEFARAAEELAKVFREQIRPIQERPPDFRDQLRASRRTPLPGNGRHRPWRQDRRLGPKNIKRRYGQNGGADHHQI